MKITKVETFVVSGGRLRDWVFVKVDTDEGIYGIGEATLEGKAQAVVGAIRDFEELLLGRDPSCIEALWQLLYRGSFWRGGPVLMTAISAIDIALWDLFGKRTNLPLYKLLGGESRKKIKVYANGWADGCTQLEEFVEKAVETVGKGFRALKFSPFGPTPPVCSGSFLKETLRCIEAVRDAVGSEVELAVDLHGRFSSTVTTVILEELSALDLLFIEEPTFPEDKKGLKHLKAYSRVPIALGERIFTKWAFVEFLEDRVVDILQPDLCHVGGITEFKKIAALGETYGVVVAPHNPLSHVATVACLHVDANIPNFLIQEVVINDVPWRDDLVDFRITPVDGYVELPPGPGLGIELNWEIVKNYPPEKGRPIIWFHEDGSLADW